MVVVACTRAGKLAAAPSSAADINRMDVLVVSRPAGTSETAETNTLPRQLIGRDRGLNEKTARGTFDAVGQEGHDDGGRLEPR